MAKSRLTRETQLAGNEEVRKQLLKHFNAIDKGFNDAIDRADEIMDYWDQYNCKLGPKQFYTGNARIYVPLVHNAVEARKTRFVNQIFPETGRYIDVTSENDEDDPYALMALLEQYCDQAKLRTQVVPANMVAGDVEGVYALQVGWQKRKRRIVTRQSSPISIGGVEHPALGEVTEIVEEEIEDSHPVVEVIADPDLMVLPATCNSIEEALAIGGSVTTVCRWTKERVEELIEEGEISDEWTAEMLTEMKRGDEGHFRDVPKKLASYCGIKAGGKFAIIYRTWVRLTINKEKYLCLAYYGGDQWILGCRLCPYWCDLPDIIAAPVKKLPGVFKGPSLVKPCADMQYAANDAVNEGMDSATYSMLPVIMTDPEKNPKIATMVMDLMAVWETSPKDTQPIQFPQLYQHAFNIVQAAERYINQTLGVSPAMIPQSSGTKGGKRNQAEIALEQQVDLLQTSDAVITWENAIGTPLIERFALYDAQFRDDEMVIRSSGEMGVNVETVTIPPLQIGHRWTFRWRGVEATRAVQRIQNQISAVNVMGQMAQNPSIKAQGYEINLVPMVRILAENAFGPRLAPEIFVNKQKQQSLDPELENQMLEEGHRVPVSPQDDDAKHIAAHQQAAQGVVGAMEKQAFVIHIAMHNAQMQQKAAAQRMQQMMAQNPQLAQQMMGGGQPGAPRPGANVQPPRRGPQQPAGMIHPDQQRGGIVQMPRRY